MGHLGAKDAYRQLGRKLDGLGTRAPWNHTLFEILNRLYTPEEAELVVRMPYGLSSLDRIGAVTGRSEAELQPMLERLAGKGLVMDLLAGDAIRYMPSPMVIGIFEFTMMRTRGELNLTEWASLFQRYLDREFFAANCGDGQQVAVMRSIPHEGSLEDPEYTEILDYERAAAIVASHDAFAIGICSCRHEKRHTGATECGVPLDTCTTFGYAAETMIRNGLARKASRGEVLDTLARSRDLGLALCGDNVQRNVAFLCHCCACCCNALAGISRFGFSNAVVTSNYIARSPDGDCTGCGCCADACPIDAIHMETKSSSDSIPTLTPMIDESICLGCGVCAVKCPTGAMRLIPRARRVLHPETVFEKVILRNLEQGTLQNQLFDHPGSVTQKFMRGFVGGFLRLPPVKRALLSDRLRSRFLATMKAGVERQGKGWLLEPSPPRLDAHRKQA